MTRVGGQSGTAIVSTTSSAEAGLTTPSTLSTISIAAAATPVGNCVFQFISVPPFREFSYLPDTLSASRERRPIAGAEQVRPRGIEAEVNPIPVAEASGFRFGAQELQIRAGGMHVQYGEVPERLDQPHLASVSSAARHPHVGRADAEQERRARLRGRSRFRPRRLTRIG